MILWPLSRHLAAGLVGRDVCARLCTSGECSGNSYPSGCRSATPAHRCEPVSLWKPLQTLFENSVPEVAVCALLLPSIRPRNRQGAAAAVGPRFASVATRKINVKPVSSQLRDQNCRSFRWAPSFSAFCHLPRCLGTCVALARQVEPNILVAWWNVEFLRSTL